MMRGGVALALLLMTHDAWGARFVSTTGSREAAGVEASAPTSDLCKAIQDAKDGEQVLIAEGTYSLGTHCIVTQRRLQLQGGYSASFKERDELATPTRIVAKRSALWLGERSDDVLIQGLVIDGAGSDAFGSQVCSECLRGAHDPSTQPPLVVLDKTGRARFQNVIFVNGPGGGVAGEGRGSVSFDNVAMVNMRPFALSVSGACGYSAPQCMDLSVKNASFVWTWRSAPEEGSPGGSAIVIGQGVAARIDRAVMAYADRVAVELDGNDPQEATLGSSVVFDNRAGDFGRVVSGKLEVSTPEGVRMERLAMPWEQSYLQRFITRAERIFYGGKLAPERAYFLSPAKDAGMKAIPGSRMTYEAAALGGVAVARPVEAVVETPPKEKVDSKKKPKKPVKKGLKKGNKEGKGK
jgi:hypothetical protein